MHLFSDTLLSALVLLLWFAPLLLVVWLGTAAAAPRVMQGLRARRAGNGPVREASSRGGAG